MNLGIWKTLNFSERAHCSWAMEDQEGISYRVCLCILGFHSAEEDVASGIAVQGTSVKPTGSKTDTGKKKKNEKTTFLRHSFNVCCFCGVHHFQFLARNLETKLDPDANDDDQSFVISLTQSRITWEEGRISQVRLLRVCTSWFSPVFDMGGSVYFQWHHLQSGGTGCL